MMLIIFKGIVLSSFFWGYIVTQSKKTAYCNTSVPGGWLATQWGGKVLVYPIFLIEKGRFRIRHIWLFFIHYFATFGC